MKWLSRGQLSPEYQLHAQIEGAKVVNVPVQATTGAFDLEALAQAITPKPNCFGFAS